MYTKCRYILQILKLGDNGTFIGTIGSKGGKPRQFNGPHGIAIDSSNNDTVYLTDMKNSRIQALDSNDAFVRQWGSFGNGTGQFSITAPGIAVDSGNRVYVIDKINAKVQMFDTNGNYLASWGTPGKGSEQLKNPEDIAVDNNNNRIYVTDTRNSRIQVLSLS
jgi:tripartite motif-containing protein 71